VRAVGGTGEAADPETQFVETEVTTQNLKSVIARVRRSGGAHRVWQGATPGEHTLVSRATDVKGAVHPTAEELARKKTFLEDNWQFPRKVLIA
jgi:hypothetical protein